jgi:GNAT superfamily N-acetyltransferase
MTIKISTQEDIKDIFKLYKIATDFQKTKVCVPWPEFDKQLIETEINENRQWKLLINGEIACVWAITFSDFQIWEERNIDPSIYIHRIATNPDFRGQNIVEKIIIWAKEYALENKKKYIRLDTVGKNSGLIEYYTKCGFEYLGLFTLKNTDQLPAHYQNAAISLFEIKL